MAHNPPPTLIRPDVRDGSMLLKKASACRRRATLAKSFFSSIGHLATCRSVRVMCPRPRISMVSQDSRGVFWSTGLVSTIVMHGLIASFWPTIQADWTGLPVGKDGSRWAE